MNIDDFYPYTYDKFYPILKDFEVKTLEGKLYKCVKKSILIEFENKEIKYFFKHKKISKRIQKKILPHIKNESFFKLSNRSPKDILENNPSLKINDDDHRTIKIKKKEAQLDILKINSIDKIEYLLNHSDRCQSDMEIYLKNPNHMLYIVLQKWLPNIGKSIEFRCFINNYKLVGICLFKPEYYSTRTVIPFERIKYFIDQILDKLKILGLNRFVIDIYILNEKTDEVHFIEINPFNSETDCFSFDDSVILNSNELLITL